MVIQGPTCENRSRLFSLVFELFSQVWHTTIWWGWVKPVHLHIIFSCANIISPIQLISVVFVRQDYSFRSLIETLYWYGSCVSFDELLNPCFWWWAMPCEQPTGHTTLLRRLIYVAITSCVRWEGIYIFQSFTTMEDKMLISTIISSRCKGACSVLKLLMMLLSCFFVGSPDPVKAPFI